MASHKRCYAVASLALLSMLVYIITIFSSSSGGSNGSRINDVLHRHLNSDESLLDENQALPPLFPFTWPSDYIGFTCAILGLLLAAGGGIGK